jgi:rod shape-determining protein MreD
MGRYLSILILGAAAALSTTILPQLLAFVVSLAGNLTPALDNTRGQINLVMLVVLAWSIRAELSSAFVWAFIGGVLIDLFSILPLGTSSAGLLIIAYFANGVARQVYRVRIFTILAMTAVATIFFYAFSYVGLLLLGNSYDLMLQTRLVLIPSLLYNLVVCLPVYGLIRLVQRRVWTAGSETTGSLTRAGGVRLSP